MSLFNSKLDRKSSTPPLFSNSMDSTIQWYAPGVIARKHALDAKLPDILRPTALEVLRKLGKRRTPDKRSLGLNRPEKGKEKGADLHSDFLMEVEIPESAEISSATNKTAAGILTLPDAPQNQPDISAAPTQSTSAQSRPTTPPNTKHPSPASAGNSPARKQRNTQTGTRVQTRSASRPKRLSLLPRRRFRFLI